MKKSSQVSTKLIRFLLSFLFGIGMLSFHNSPLSKRDNPPQNDISWVTAPSGLSVRSQPNIKGKKLAVLPYRSQIIIQKKTNIPFEVNENGYRVTGEWLETTIDSISDKPVYVFSGYVKTEWKKLDESVSSFFEEEANHRILKNFIAFISLVIS